MLNNQIEEEVQAFFEKVGAFDHLFTTGVGIMRESHMLCCI
ncbi:hypothetical protein NSS94_23985 [Paenibacillus sp. FSL L8-0644]